MLKGMKFLIKKKKKFADKEKMSTFAIPNEKGTSSYTREHSSVGSERLPYKQRVGGSNPSAPTKHRRKP